MTPVPPSPDVAASVAASADRLARAMVDTLGSGASLMSRVEVERFVAACVTWAGSPDDHPAPDRADLIEAALREIATWDAAEAAAAWQLTLSAIGIAADDAPTLRSAAR